MGEIEVKSAQEAERTRVVAALMAGFLADPLIRWCWPDPEAYFANGPKLMHAYGGRAFEHACAWTDGAIRGAALWLPPGITPDEEEMGHVVASTLAGEKQAHLYAALAELGAYHPHEPHWFLPVIGVDPIHQGQGIGAALMRHAVAKCDEDGKRAYLESTNPRNLTLYKRHGFQVVGEVRSGDCPVLTAMVREPGR